MTQSEKEIKSHINELRQCLDEERREKERFKIQIKNLYEGIKGIGRHERRLENLKQGGLLLNKPDTYINIKEN